MIWIFDELFHKLSQLLFLSKSQNQYFLFLIKLPRLVHVLCGRCVRKEREALIYITWFLYAISINLISSSLFFLFVYVFSFFSGGNKLRFSISALLYTCGGVPFHWSGTRGGALPINGLYGEVPSVRYYKVVEKFMYGRRNSSFRYLTRDLQSKYFKQPHYIIHHFNVFKGAWKWKENFLF